MIKDIPAVVDTITRVIGSTCQTAVVGLSGGADSTLVAVLCKKALGEKSVFGIHMPFGEIDRHKFNGRSAKLADHLGIRQKTIAIAGACRELELAFNWNSKDPKPLTDLNGGNMRSRMRMVALYTASTHFREEGYPKCRVIGTGNLSEDFIGYDTKGGDALCDIFPIGELFKSEVYQLLEYFRDQGEILEEHIDRVPSAGLWDGQTDEGELGYSYNQMEPVIKEILKYQYDTNVDIQQHMLDHGTVLQKFVVERHRTHKHKHLAPPTISLRNYCD